MDLNNLYNALESIGERVRDRYKADLKAGDHIATGKLFNSIDYKLTVTGDSIKLYFIALDYYMNIENGQKKGTHVDVDVIKKWMVSKNIGGGDKRAYLISRKISSKGTKANPYLRSIKRSLPNYKEEIMIAIKKDVKFEMDKIIIKNKLKNGNNNNQ